MPLWNLSRFLSVHVSSPCGTGSLALTTLFHFLPSATPCHVWQLLPCLPRIYTIRNLILHGAGQQLLGLTVVWVTAPLVCDGCCSPSPIPCSGLYCPSAGPVGDLEEVGDHGVELNWCKPRRNKVLSTSVFPTFFVSRSFLSLKSETAPDALKEALFVTLFIPICLTSVLKFPPCTSFLTSRLSRGLPAHLCWCPAWFSPLSSVCVFQRGYTEKQTPALGLPACLGSLLLDPSRSLNKLQADLLKLRDVLFNLLTSQSI